MVLLPCIAYALPLVIASDNDFDELFFSSPKLPSLNMPILNRFLAAVSHKFKDINELGDHPVHKLHGLCNYADISDINAMQLENSVLCLQCNVHSVFVNFTSLCDMLHELDYACDFIVLTETWCSSECSKLFSVPGYFHFHSRGTPDNVVVAYSSLYATATLLYILSGHL